MNSKKSGCGTDAVKKDQNGTCCKDKACFFNVWITIYVKHLATLDKIDQESVFLQGGGAIP